MRARFARSTAAGSSVTGWDCGWRGEDDEIGNKEKY
jgi:hypothetical protein